MNNLDELDKNLNELLDLGRKEESGDSHIVEWIKQTSKDAVPPDLLREQQSVLPPPPRDIGSPTFTDNSLTYSQTVSLLRLP